ncbi:sulfatase-like hydrolase/transferase [Cupriavidus basilensis]
MSTAILQQFWPNLDAGGLTDKTIVILTSDHGDMDGAQPQLHAKGAVSYREQNNVPLIIAHPAYQGGRQCRAVTSHLGHRADIGCNDWHWRRQACCHR